MGFYLCGLRFKDSGLALWVYIVIIQLPRLTAHLLCLEAKGWL